MIGWWDLWYIQILTCLKCLIDVQWCNTVGLLCGNNCWPVVTFFSAYAIIWPGLQEGRINILQVLKIITLLIYIYFTSYMQTIAWRKIKMLILKNRGKGRRENNCRFSRGPEKEVDFMKFIRKPKFVLVKEKTVRQTTVRY